MNASNIGFKEYRVVNWSFKRCGENLRKMPVPCMDPTFTGIMDDATIRREVEFIRETGFNTLMIEGLRRLMLYEHEGKSADVRAAIKHAVEIAHGAGLQVFYHSTCSFAAPILDGFTEAEKSMLSQDGDTGRYAYLKSWGGWYLWCINNPDFKSEYYRLAKLMVEETGVDGMMTDEVYFRTCGWLDCVCPHCVTGFGKRTPKVNFSDPNWRAWLRFRLKSVGDFYEGLRAAIGSLPLMGCKNDEPNPIHSQLYGENNDERMRGISILFTEIYDRDLKKNWPITAANCAAYQGLAHFWKVPLMIFGCCDVHDIEFIYALCSAHNGNPWAASSALVEHGDLSPEDNLSSVPDDAKEWKRLFDWENRHIEFLHVPVQSTGITALLLSASTRDQYSCENTDFVEEFHGWCKALTEAHVQFDVITEYELTFEALKKYKVLIFPQAVCLPDIDLSGFRGKILATGASGTCDSTGAVRAKPLFKDLLPLQTFDIHAATETAASLRLLNRIPSLLVKSGRLQDGLLIHLVNCGPPLCMAVVLEIPSAAYAVLFSPDFPDEVRLEASSGTVVIPAELIHIYSVIYVKTQET